MFSQVAAVCTDLCCCSSIKCSTPVAVWVLTTDVCSSVTESHQHGNHHVTHRGGHSHHLAPPLRPHTLSHSHRHTASLYKSGWLPIANKNSGFVNRKKVLITLCRLSISQSLVNQSPSAGPSHIYPAIGAQRNKQMSNNILSKWKYFKVMQRVKTTTLSITSKYKVRALERSACTSLFRSGFQATSGFHLVMASSSASLTPIFIVPQYIMICERKTQDTRLLI